MKSGLCLFFFKQKTAYDMRISDWSSDVCSSDLRDHDREDQCEPDDPARRAPRRVDVAAPHRLADQHRRRNAEAEEGDEHQEHDDVGVGGRGERAFAAELGGPERIQMGGARVRESGWKYVETLWECVN